MASFSEPLGYTRVDSPSMSQTRSGSSSKRAEAKSEPEDPLVEALRRDLKLEDWAIHEAAPDAARRRSRSTRATAAESGGNDLTIEVNLADGEEAVVLVEQDGEYTWVLHPTKKPTPKDRKRGSSEKARPTTQFRIEIEGPMTRSGTRGRSESLPKRIFSYVFKFVARAASKYAMKWQEQDVKTGLVALSRKRITKDPPTSLLDVDQWTYLPDPASLKLPKSRAPKVLLLVHGTFSSTTGSFGALAKTEWGKAFLTAAAQTYDLILGFDHKTLSEDPMENALHLEESLRAMNWNPKHPAVFDAIAFSRGGLVLRSFIERVLPNLALPLSFKTGILVGATNGGTDLAEPKNWKTFVDFYTNLAHGAAQFLTFLGVAAGASGIVAGVIRGLGSLVKYLAHVAVEDRSVPGLAAMLPGGEFVRLLNEENTGQPKPEELAYYAITSDFEYSSSTTEISGLGWRFLARLADGAVDQFMHGRPNDLVVHTASMSEVDPGTPDLLKGIRALGHNTQVYHLVYFAHPEVGKALTQWLSLGVDASVFKIEKRRARQTRGAKTFQFEAIQSEDIEPKSLLKRSKGTRSGITTSSTSSHDQPPIEVEVVWDNLQNVEADVYAVGHYRGIRPQRAEWALDQFVSAREGRVSVPDDQLILTQLTDQGHLVGELGDIDLYPIARAAYEQNGSQKGRLAAICGMGYPGTFDEYGLRLLTSNLIGVLNLFPDLQTLCTVLIGSGEGGLSIKASIRSALQGYAQALHSGNPSSRVRKIKIVELYRHRAELIHDSLKKIADAPESGISLAEQITSGEDGLYHESHRRSYALARMAFACQSGDADDDQALAHLLKELPSGLDDADVTASLAELITPVTADIARLARHLHISNLSDQPEDASVPTRISFVRSDTVLKSAAITDSTTVPERIIDVAPSLIAEAARRMNAPTEDKLKDLSKLMFSLVIPRDFRSLMSGSAPLVFEVDRHMAAVHWEMLTTSLDNETYEGIGLGRPVSRQLRTTYSAPPTPNLKIEGRLKALVIGDPDDTLPGARAEALEVIKHLDEAGVDVEPLIGSAGASRFDTLRHLLLGKYHIVHYAGHGTYDAIDPSKTGWVFQGGILRAAEIRRMDTPPLLVFANACLSSRNSVRHIGSIAAKTDPQAESDMQTEAESDNAAQVTEAYVMSQAERAYELERRPYGDAGLLPSLADEFFKCGVRNYIGAAWEVDDAGALAFALSFYTALLSGKKPIGEALFDARGASAREKSYGCLWGAYQHYGDPGFKLSL